LNTDGSAFVSNDGTSFMTNGGRKSFSKTDLTATHLIQKKKTHLMIDTPKKERKESTLASPGDL
jgi:hypothetical protein